MSEWGEEYARKADAFSSTPRWLDEAAEMQFRVLYGPGIENVVDWGGNTGKLIRLQRKTERKLNWSLVDPNTYALSQAPEGVQTYESMARVPKASQDAIIAMHSLPQMHRLDWELCWAWNALRRGGVIGVMVHSPAFDKMLSLKNKFNGYKRDATIKHQLSGRQLRQLMWDNGFVPDKLYAYGTGVPGFRRRIVFIGHKGA